MFCILARAPISVKIPGLMNRKLLYLFFGLALLLSSCAKEFTELNLPKIVTVSTSPASTITLTTATIGGSVSSAEQHPITSRGIVYGRVQNPTFADSTALSGSGSGVFSTTLSGLAPSTRYYARAFATVDLGTAYGNQLSFTTLAPPPPVGLASITTTVPTFLLSTVRTGGNVTSDGGAAVTARGVAYGTAQNPTTANSTTSDGTGIGAFTSTLTGLTASTRYYVRAYATNSVGTAYGNEVSFTTLSAFTCGTSTVSDVDNNTYATVQIGTQCWTRSNLKVSKYRNGDNISNITDQTAWSMQTTITGAWCNYNNDAANDALYGKLYNWYAVNDIRRLCPAGWHVPSDAEWTTLIDSLGGASAAGGAMKSTATQPTPGGWDTPNTGATNSSGFTGLPGGFRWCGLNGFDKLGDYGIWWSSSVYANLSSNLSWYRGLFYGNANTDRHYNGRCTGYSVRCVRD